MMVKTKTHTRGVPVSSSSLKSFLKVSLGCQQENHQAQNLSQKHQKSFPTASRANIDLKSRRL